MPLLSGNQGRLGAILVVFALSRFHEEESALRAR